MIKKVKKNKRFKKLNGTLKNSTESALDKYFKTLNGTKPDNLYNLVIKEVEAPLLKKLWNTQKIIKLKHLRFLALIEPH